MSNNFVVTGTSGYLGQEISRYLAEEQGANVLGISRSAPKSKPGGNFRNFHTIDLLNFNHLKKLRSVTEKHFGDEPFNVVNAVGYFYAYETMLDTPLAEAHRIMDASYTTVYNTAHTLIQPMIDRGGGHFIVFSCLSTRYNYPKMTPFVASKSALNALVKQIANEYGHHITSNALMLTTLKTETEKTMKPNGDYDNWLELSEVAKTVYELSRMPKEFQGNFLELKKYSESFYGKSVNDRQKK